MPGQIYVRSTDVNRTHDSALSQMVGLYPPETYPFRLQENQTSLDLVPFKVSESLTKDLGLAALPNAAPIVPYAPEYRFDRFDAESLCPGVNYWITYKKNDDFNQKVLQPKYADHIREFAETFGYDPETFTAA